MLRTTCTSLSRNTSALRTLSTVRSFTTAVPPPSEKKTKAPLSERLGAGRGKALDASSDPFASFLASAKNNRGPNRRNGNFTPRQKKNDNNKTTQPGQFDDAEKKVTASGEQQAAKKRNNNRNNNNNNNNNRNRKPQQAKSAGNEGEKRDQRPNRKNNMRRNKSQSEEVRTRRATAFIDKDIDWASFDTAEEVAVQVQEGQEENSEALLKDIQGDYQRYLQVGSDVNWAKAIDATSVSTLIGSNATFDYQQKAAFLSTLSNATSGGAAATARK